MSIITFQIIQNSNMGNERILGTGHNNMPRTLQVQTNKGKGKYGCLSKREKLEDTIIQIEFSADMLHEDNNRVVGL